MVKRTRIDPNNFTRQALEPAVEVLRASGVLAYPTETVYGLGADAFSESAVQRIYDIKGRGLKKAVSVMVADMGMVGELVDNIDERVRRVIDTFWPGPLTIVLRAGKRAPARIVSDEGKIGIRFPDHKLSRDLVALLGRAITSTSANLSGKPAPAEANEVADSLGDKIDHLIDGGACTFGVPSTVIDVTGNEIKLLRPGAIDFSKIETLK